MTVISTDKLSIFAGPVFRPDDPGYAPEITGMNLAPTRTPQLVAGATSTEDVAAAVRYAREHHLPVSIVGGGHGSASIASGLTLTTRRMKSIRVDPGRKTVTFESGALWKSIIEAAAPHGLFPIAGSSSGVGAVGYLLAGGIGPLGRSHGYSSDYIEELTVVTGTGEIVTASSGSNPELFWALRGGKYGLGIVTEVTLRLVELRQIYGGALTFAEDQLDRAFRGWIEWTRTADEQVTTSFATVSFPDMDGPPPQFRGKRISFLRFAYPGDAERGAQLAAPLRDLAPVLHDDIGLLPVDQIDRIHNDPTTPMPAWLAGGQLGALDGTFADAWLARFGTGKQPPLQVSELRHGGAAQRHAPKGGDAVANRDAHFAMGTICVAPPLFAEVAPAYARALLESLSPWTLPVANVNFIGHNPLPSPWASDVATRLDVMRRSVDPDGILSAQ